MLPLGGKIVDVCDGDAPTVDWICNYNDEVQFASARCYSDSIIDRCVYVFSVRRVFQPEAPYSAADEHNVTMLFFGADFHLRVFLMLLEKQRTVKLDS